MADSSPLAHSPTLASTPGTADDSLARGAVVGEFIVERFLGAGAMGEVYAGVHPVIGKKVAIKVLRREVGASHDGAERFKREARAVNQVDHPNVIDIFSFGRLDDGRLYLVMDLVEGRSLRKALVDGPLAVDAALDVLGVIADALDAAHARGVIHRDLKPDNVMLGSGQPPTVHVLDFGLAKLFSAADADAQVSMLTGQGTWLGTPGYMAPEQWSADGAGPASDRYSLGVMAFELLSGSLPFQAASLPQMMEQHFRAKVPALSSRGATPACSTFDPILERAMAKDPARRFATGRAMVEALRAVAGSAARARPHVAPTRARWLPAIAGVAVLALSVTAVLVVRGGRDPAVATDPAERRPLAAPANGLVRIAVASIPSAAEVHRDGRLVGTTPAELDLPPHTALVVELKKPGYTTVRHAMEVPAHGAALPPFVLVAIAGFEGVWALPNGELRGFTRTGERVEVSKLASVDGEREFFRHYRLVSSDAGVEFTSTESSNLEPAAPNEPSCHVPHDTTYHYDPGTDALSVRQQRVRHRLLEGKCVIMSSAFLAAMPLARADRPTSHERESIAPVGVPRPPPTKLAPDKGPVQTPVKQPVTKTPPSNGRPAPTKGKVAPPEPEQLQKQNSLGNLPGELRNDRTPPAQPRGDAQVAPQVEPPPQQVQQQRKP